MEQNENIENFYDIFLRLYQCSLGLRLRRDSEAKLNAIFELAVLLLNARSSHQTNACLAETIKYVEAKLMEFNEAATESAAPCDKTAGFKDLIKIISNNALMDASLWSLGDDLHRIICAKSEELNDLVANNDINEPTIRKQESELIDELTHYLNFSCFLSTLRIKNRFTL